MSASTTAGASAAEVGDKIHHTRGQACFDEGIDDQSVHARAEFRRLEHHRVAAGQRHGDGANAENDRRIPWRHATQTPAGWRTAMAKVPA